MLDHPPIASSPKVLGGALVFAGTRVPVQTLLDYLNDGFSLDQFLQKHFLQCSRVKENEDCF
jgi:uncharacterized protein (DUF433 family)